MFPFNFIQQKPKLKQKTQKHRNDLKNLDNIIDTLESFTRIFTVNLLMARLMISLFMSAVLIS